MTSVSNEPFLYIVSVIGVFEQTIAFNLALKVITFPFFVRFPVGNSISIWLRYFPSHLVKFK